MLFISLDVRAVEFVILVKPIGISTHVLMRSVKPIGISTHVLMRSVKPIGISTHVLMSIFFRDKNSHIFKHLSVFKGCRDKCDISCFKILDHASTYSQLKIKESFHIEQLKPELNKQVEHVSLSLHF